jgi:hypothetical protein
VKILQGADSGIDTALPCIRHAATAALPLAHTWWPGIEQATVQATNSKICTRTRTSRAEFSPEAVVAGGGAFWRVFLPQYLGYTPPDC